MKRSSQLNLEDLRKMVDEEENVSEQSFIPFTELLPDELLLKIFNDDLLSVKNKMYFSSVNKPFYGLFCPEIGKQEAQAAAECAINPTAENVEKLETLLKECPPLLLHPMTVTNRFGKKIKGSVYQIALHEGDNELIDDVITPAFRRLYNGSATMEAQKNAWLPKGWMEAEEKTCEIAFKAIDNVFTAFKNATSPNDVIVSPHSPYTVTINKQEASDALDAFRKAINTLYAPTVKVIESGCDPIIRLMERIVDRYKEKYEALGGYNAPRNLAVLRSVFGFSQRTGPINFMQAFAMGVHYLVEKKIKVIRSFVYPNWKEHFILPVDEDPNDRLGYEHYAAGWKGGGPGRGAGWLGIRALDVFQNFFSIKNSSYPNPALLPHSRP